MKAILEVERDRWLVLFAGGLALELELVRERAWGFWVLRGESSPR